MEPRNSNLQLLLRHILSQYQPYSGGRWFPSLEFYTLEKNQSHKGSIIWNKVTIAWKTMRMETSYIRPSNLDELLSCSIWFYPCHPIVGPCFSKALATVLYRKGMRYYRDLWRHTRFLELIEAQNELGLLAEDMGAWIAMTQAMWRQWSDILIHQTPKVGSG